MEDYKNDKVICYIIDVIALIIWIVMITVCYKNLGFEISVLFGITYIVWQILRFMTKLKL